MFEKCRHSTLFFWSLELLILGALVFISSKINFVFHPIGTFFSTLFTPVLVSGFLYYLLNPIVTVMEKRLKIPRIIGIILVFVLLIAVIVLSLINLIPSLISQLSDLAASVPSFVRDIEKWAMGLEKYPALKGVDIQSYVDKLDLSYGSIISSTLNGIAGSIGSIFSVVTTTAVLIGTVPFVLFYMLKDGEKLVPLIRPMLPKKHTDDIVELLGEMNKTIATYISGQAIECLFVGTMMFIGYLILGLRYAFLFAVIAGLTNLIPYLGPYLGLAPAFLFTVFNNPIKALLCILVVVIVQQLDGNIVYPNVIGKTLQIHPLTIIFILLVAGNLAGLLGIFLGVPFYAICKTLVKYIYNIIQTNKESKANDKRKDLLS
jgi:predicted PurR-regulated permease PerM